MLGLPAEGTRLAETYRHFASLEAAGKCEIYRRLCDGLAGDAELLSLIESLPLAKRQPNLILAASRWFGAPLDSYVDYREWMVAHWPQVREIALTRRTQTNEAARADVIAPVLARLPQPLALVEVGASAGLCLYPAGVDVVWRAGLDLNPLDVTNPDDVRWLECLIWPSQPHRLARLRAAIAIAKKDPPLLVRGDLTTDDLDHLLACAPKDATLVVFHTAVLAYVDEAARRAFAQRMSVLDGHWISNEAPGVMHPGVRDGLLVLALDGTPVAATGSHGEAFHWLGPT